MAELVIIFWRDIPAQVITKRSRREQAKRVLPDRFEKAIDMAAMRAKMIGSDAYLGEWRKSDPVVCGDDLEAEVERVVNELDQKYDKDYIKRLIEHKGFEPSGA